MINLASCSNQCQINKPKLTLQGKDAVYVSLTSTETDPEPVVCQQL